MHMIHVHEYSNSAHCTLFLICSKYLEELFTLIKILPENFSSMYPYYVI